MSKKELPQDPGPRPHFTFLRQWMESIEDLPDQNKGRMLIGLVRYALDRQEPTFEERIDRVLWRQIKAALDYGWMKYNAGKVGGAPRGNRNAQK